MRSRLLALAFLIGCGPGNKIDHQPDARVEGDGGAPLVDAAPSADATPTFQGVIYAHSNSDLYTVDPDTLQISHVGPFIWPASIVDDVMTDIAVDHDGNITGVSFDKVYSVDHLTVMCTYLAPLTEQFNGLSYVPSMAIDGTPGNDVLVGATLAGDLWRVDPTTGATTLIGNYNGGFTSSGDIVSVDGFGTVATAKSTGQNDVLVRIDPTSGTATLIGDTGFIDIWGLGYWKNKIYGFLSTDQFVIIDPMTGAGTLVTTATVNWWGAGVTTSAPIIP
jgi:hypothetical protein